MSYALSCRFAFVIGLALWTCAASAQQEVRVPSLDGTELKAWWFEAKPAPTQTTAQTTAQIAQTDAARRPVVVAMHGCGGLYAAAGRSKGQLNARHQAMGEMLQAQGYHVVFPDSLATRGETSLCAQAIGTRQITQRQRRADALGALAWVRQQPWADGARVALLGWSNGGSSVLAATDGAHPLVLEQVRAQTRAAAPFKTAIAFYPGCTDTLTSGYALNTSLTLFLGADDDWTPPGPCIAMAKALESQAKQTVELNVYPGAVHDFDTPLPGVRERADVPSRLRPGRGVMTGQNPAAREASWARVRELLAGAFR